MELCNSLALMGHKDKKVWTMDKFVITENNYCFRKELPETAPVEYHWGAFADGRKYFFFAGGDFWFVDRDFDPGDPGSGDNDWIDKHSVSELTGPEAIFMSVSVLEDLLSRPSGQESDLVRQELSETLCFYRRNAARFGAMVCPLQ